MNLTFEDLEVHYRTGKSVVISGTGKDRVMGYRAGMMCNAGDLEETEWKNQVHSLIERSGEKELYDGLAEYVKENCPWLRKKSDQETEALELHASRIFDNDSWVGFVPFNKKYRPEILKQSK